MGLFTKAVKAVIGKGGDKGDVDATAKHNRAVRSARENNKGKKKEKGEGSICK